MRDGRQADALVTRAAAAPATKRAKRAAEDEREAPLPLRGCVRTGRKWQMPNDEAQPGTGARRRCRRRRRTSRDAVLPQPLAPAGVSLEASLFLLPFPFSGLCPFACRPVQRTLPIRLPAGAGCCRVEMVSTSWEPLVDGFLHDAAVCPPPIRLVQRRRHRLRRPDDSICGALPHFIVAALSHAVAATTPLARMRRGSLSGGASGSTCKREAPVPRRGGWRPLRGRRARTGSSIASAAVAVAATVTISVGCLDRTHRRRPTLKVQRERRPPAHAPSCRVWYTLVQCSHA